MEKYQNENILLADGTSRKCCERKRCSNEKLVGSCLDTLSRDQD
jgi:hypothetical protein